MSKRKFRLLDKILVVSGVTFALFMLGFWLALKRSNKDYYIPASYEGWITVKYGWPEAPALPERDGAFQLSISDSGYLATSTPLNVGWGRDRYFQVSDGDTIPISKSIEQEGELRLYIHANRYEFYSHEDFLKKITPGIDTTLWDGTNIAMAGEVSYQTGDKTLEFFYRSAEPQSIMFVPPENPSKEYLKSVEDYRLRK